MEGFALYATVNILLLGGVAWLALVARRIHDDAEPGRR